MKIKTILTTFLLSLCMLVSGSLLVTGQTLNSAKTNFVKAEDIDLTEVSNPSQFTYQDLSDGTVEITGIKDVVETQLDVKFPSTSDGESSKAVTKIADNAFSENTNIYSVTIPASVKTIGEHAFYKCDNLTTLTFDNESQLEQIGSYAFANEIVNDEENQGVNKIIGNKITSIRLPKSVKTISSYAFYNCEQLSEFTFEPDSMLTTIGSYAFAGDDMCKKQEITGLSAFTKKVYTSASGLSTFEVPKSVKTIEDHAFYKCSSLTEFTFEEESNLTTIGAYAFAGGEYSHSSGYYYYNDTDIVSNKISTINLPKSVETIEDYAFYNCPSLTTFTFETESNLKTIGAYAFSAGKSSKYSNTSIGWNYTFEANNISTIEIPKSVTTIKDHAFYDCDKLVNLTFETGSLLDTIESYVFGGEIYSSATRNVGAPVTEYSTISAGVKNLTIPKNVKTIKGHAFYLCTSLSDLTFEADSALQEIGSYAFGGAVYQSYTHSSYGTTYSDRTIGLTSLEIPKSVKTIGDHAFYLCSSLTNLTFEGASEGESSLQTIGSYAFAGNNYQISYSQSSGSSREHVSPQVSSLVIPKSVKTIGDHAFYLYSSLTNLTFETGSLLESIGSYAFGGDTYQTSSGRPMSSSKYDDTYTHVSPQVSSLVIPKSVTEIGDHAFYLYSSLTDLTFETGSLLESIGSHAFAGDVYAKEKGFNGGKTIKCKNTEVLPQFTSLEIPKNVTTIEDHAFYLCSSLTNLTFEGESSLQEIGSYAFAGLQYTEITPTESGDAVETTEYKEVLPQISTLTIPKSVTTIGNYAFYLNGNLSTLTFDDDSVLETIGAYAFSGITNNDDETNEHDVVPQISSVKIPKTVTQIGNSAFYYNKTLSTLTFDPQSQLQTIGDSAFRNTLISELTVPAKVTSIGANSFDSCASLTTVKFAGNEITKIGSSAFVGCTQISEITLPGSVTTLGDTVFDDAIETIYLDSKTQYDTLKSKLTPYDEKVTYQITITFKESGSVTRTDYKLWKRGLDWAKVGGVWTSGQDYSFPEGTWRDAGKQEFTAETLGQRFTSGEIEDNIVLNKRVIVHSVESDVDGINATSVEGFDDTATLEVEEITDAEQIQLKLGDKYSENIVKIYVVELRDGGVEYTEVSDLIIHFNESLASGNGVYLFDSDLTKQLLGSGEYTFDATSCTIVLRDDTIRSLTQDEVTAELEEGFPEDVTLSVTHYTATSDEDDIRRELDAAYSDLVEDVYVIELKQAGGAYTNESVTITLPDTFGEGLVVKILDDGNLVAWVPDNGKYSHTGTKIVVALLNKAHRIDSDIDGIYATSEAGFEEGTQLNVTTITEVDQIKAQIGEDLYNENIQKIYVIEIQGNKPVDYKIFVSSTCEILGDKLAVLGENELTDVTVSGETLLFENKTGTAVVSQNPPVELLHRIDSNIDGIYATSDAGFEEGTQLNVTTITDADQIKAQIGEELYNENIQKIYVIEIQGTKPADYKIFVSSTCEILGDKLAVLGENELTDVTVSGETLLFENKTGTAVVSQNPPAPPTDPDPVDPDPDAPDDENPTDTDNKDKSGKSLWWLWLLIALVVLLLILLIIFLVWKRRKEEDSAAE